MRTVSSRLRPQSLAALLFAFVACHAQDAAPPPAPCPPLPPPPVAVAPVAAPAPAPAPVPTGPVAKPLDHALARPDVIATSAPVPGFMKGINLGNCLDA